ncbi:hypothetical protein JTB14_030905 [Gonioctena quinquepunctata]|nr:hypothetical protein JTB14_030905 [Gonioctena quinquepunctata]
MMKVAEIFLLVCVLQIANIYCVENSPDIELKFESEESMAARPFQLKDCSKAVHEGAYFCRGNHEVWQWSVQDKKCVIGHYGGCHSTKNNFQSYDECTKIAAPVCSNN